MEVAFQPVTYLINGFGVQGQLVFLDGRLAAALALLDGDAYLPRHQGLWNLEAGFGACDPMLRSEPFKSLDEAAAWVADQFQPRVPRTIRCDRDAVPQPGAHATLASPACPDGERNKGETGGSL